MRELPLARRSAGRRADEAGRSSTRPNAPVVVFDRCRLAFDDKVILQRRQLHAAQGPHEDLPGRQRRRQVHDPQADSRAAQAGRRRDLGERRARGPDERARDDDACAPISGMVFQEGALFDSLTVARERRLQAVRRAALARRQGATARVRGGARLHRPRRASSTGCRRSSRAASGGAWRLPARWPPSRASCSTTSRPPASTRSRRRRWTRRSSSCATSRASARSS